MDRVASYLGRIALVLGFLVPAASLSVVRQSHAAGTCTPIAAPASNVSPSGTFDTAANVIATFDSARQAEGCTVPLSIDQTSFNSASSQQQMLMLFNAERQDRGLPPLQLDSHLLSQIDLNHGQEMVQYNYFNHPSPINQPGSGNVFNRLTVNPAINGHWSYLGEDIAAGYSTAAAAVYAYMYQDSGSSWGHRENILGYASGTFGHYNWVGIGVATGGQYGVYYTSDFLQGSAYTPPSATDTQAPTLAAPTVVSGTPGGTVSVQVTGVQDSGAGSGAAGVTGVVFYANSVTMDSSGNANTVIATKGTGGIWTASLTLSVGATLHAVAVDGSGNFKDCAAGSTSCGATVAPTATPTSVSATTTPQPTATITPHPTATNTPVTATATPSPTATHTVSPTATTTPSAGATNTPTANSTQQLIANGGFESGKAPWSESSAGGYEIISTQKFHSGTDAAWFCGYGSCNDQLSQTVSLPSSLTKLTLAYWYYSDTKKAAGSACTDQFVARIKTTGGSVIVTPQSSCNTSVTNGWVQQSYDITSALMPYAGQSVTLAFQGTTNSSTAFSEFFVDDVTLTATGGSSSPPAPTATTTTVPAATATMTPNPAATATSTAQPTATNTSVAGPTNTAVSTPQQLIGNGGFESGTAPWAESSSGGYQLIASTKVHSGTHSAWFCDYANCNDQLSQAVTLPSSLTKLTLSYWYYSDTRKAAGSPCTDQFVVRIKTSGGAVITTPQSACNTSVTNGWVQQSYDLTSALASYAGQSVSLAFQGTTNTSSTTSEFFVDDVSLIAS